MLELLLKEAGVRRGNSRVKSFICNEVIRGFLPKGAGLSSFRKGASIFRKKVQFLALTFELFLRGTGSSSSFRTGAGGSSSFPKGAGGSSSLPKGAGGKLLS